MINNIFNKAISIFLIAAEPRFIKLRSNFMKRSGAFTLIEILIAITILGIVMATVIGTFTGIIFNSRLAQKRTELHQTGRALLDLISTDIRGIYKYPTGEGGPFFQGNIESIEGPSTTRMDFVTTNSLSIGRQKKPFLSEVSYFLNKNEKRGGGDLYSLLRRSQSPPEAPYENGGRAVPVCRIVENFKLEFLDNNAKKERLSNIIPSSIIISFVLNLDGEKETFMTMVRPMIAAGSY